MTQGWQGWICECCGGESRVRVTLHEDAYTVIERIRDAHRQEFPRCDERRLEFRIVRSGERD